VKPRDYQTKAANAVFQAWLDGFRSALVVLPTGTGKTVLFADIIKRSKKRTMVLVHRQELVWQARDKIQKFTGLRVDVEMGNYRATMDKELFNPDAKVIVSTVQTQTAGGDGSGRMLKFNPDDFDLLVCDEAHHFVSPSFARNIDHYKKNPELKIFACTATPDRLDEKALGEIFDCVAFDYEILDAIHDGWLVPIEQQMVSIGELDLSAVRTTAGDLNGADLAAIMEAEKPLHGVVSSTVEIIADRKTIVFASSVNHARMMANIFNRHRTGMAAYVSAQTPELERRQIVSDFAKGKIQVLSNCGIFLEGFDDPGVEVIAMAKPTKSRALYAQMAGRSTRPHESIAHKLNDMEHAAKRRWLINASLKPKCLIIDFVGNSGRHKLITVADVLGGNVSNDVIEAANKFAREAGKPVRMDKTLEEQELIVEQRKKREAEELAQKANLKFKAPYKTQIVDPFDILQIKPAKPRGWDDKKTFTDGCSRLLRNVFKVDPAVTDYATGMSLIREFYRRKTDGECTFGQAKILKKNGLDIHMKFPDAQKAIDEIAQRQGWGKPKEKVEPVSVQPLDDVDSDIPF
jgi:superfamily II DNA or RNA helicase